VSEDADAWDERYRAQEAMPGQGPAAFLAENVGLLPDRGKVLDIAMGTGSNALFLAERGYEVTGIDISAVAVERAGREARERGLRLNAICADLRSYRLRPRSFDVVLVFYYLQRDLCPQIAGALSAGGVLVFETFTTEQRQFGWGPAKDDHLLRPGELRGLFPGLEELAFKEGVVQSERGKRAVAGLIARRRG
jgi:SAM-dependent methyltransferase